MTQLTGDGYPGTTTVLQRNRFYPRKLMEVRHWQAEQAYHRRSRELLTRLGLGTGVLCGLDVTRDDDGHARHPCGDRRRRLRPDRRRARGHPRSTPAALTDDCGAGPPVRLRRADRSVSTSASRVRHRRRRAAAGTVRGRGLLHVASMTREAFAISVSRTLPPPLDLPPEVCHELFGPRTLTGTSCSTISIRGTAPRPATASHSPWWILPAKPRLAVWTRRFARDPIQPPTARPDPVPGRTGRRMLQPADHRAAGDRALAVARHR